MLSRKIDELAEHFVAKSKFANQHDVPAHQRGHVSEGLRETLNGLPEIRYALLEILSLRLAMEVSAKFTDAPIGSDARVRLLDAATIGKSREDSLTVYLIERISSSPSLIHTNEILGLNGLISQSEDAVESLIDFAGAIARVEAL